MKRSKWTTLPVLLLTGALALSVGGTGASAATRNPVPSKSTLTPRTTQTTRALTECRADGATLTRAMSGFKAHNAGRRPTVRLLESKVRGGPFIQVWPYNPTYYRYSIDAQGVLDLALLKSAGPPFVYSRVIAYRGPQDCSGVVTLAGAQKVLRAVGDCEADGTTVTVALAAFKKHNPKGRPTVAALEARAHGGPYLRVWPHNPAYYRYSIDSQGVLEIAIVKSSGAYVTFSALTPYRGPQDCSFG